MLRYHGPKNLLSISEFYERNSGKHIPFLFVNMLALFKENQFSSAINTNTKL